MDSTRVSYSTLKGALKMAYSAVNIAMASDPAAIVRRSFPDLSEGLVRKVVARERRRSWDYTH